MKGFIKTLITGFIFTISISTHAETIDFQALEHVDATNMNHGFQYIEDGFQIDDLTATTELTSWGTLATGYSGSTAMFNNATNGITQLSKVGGGTFDLNSIDLAEVTSSSVASITFTRDGGHSQTFTIDGVAYGAETFIFDNGFLGSTSVTWVQVSPFHQFDNIVVNAAATTPAAIPTLSNIGLGILVLLLIGYSQRRRFGVFS